MNGIPTIGQMYHSIKIQNYTLDKKDNGEEAPLWADYITVMAAVDITQATESEINERLSRMENVDFLVRTITGLSTKMRIIYDNRIFQITGIIPINRRYQKIKAELSQDWTDEYLTSQNDVTADDVDITSDKVYI